MAKICVGLHFQGHLNRLCVFVVLFGLSFGNQLEISELVENFDEVNLKEHLRERHYVVRRAAGTVQPTSSRPTSKPWTVSPRISSSSLKQSVSPTRSSLNVASVRPSATTMPVVKSVSVVTIPTTSGPLTSNKPATGGPTGDTTSSWNGTATTKYKSTSKETVPERSTSTTPFPTESDFQDHHTYYTSHYYGNGNQWWFNLEDGSNKLRFHTELSKNIKFSDLFKTSFVFPYYGHLINNVTITNKGYVFLGKRLHRFNASAQYAAPLMADFGADLHDKTSIRYIDTGDRLTVEWANMRLKNVAKDKEFSFQCSIFKNGTLVFAYKKIPIAVNTLSDNDFFVRVGISDTFRIEKVKRKQTINGKKYTVVRYIYYYLYDKVQLMKDKVRDGSAYVLTPLPNCVMFNSCGTCLNTQTKFECSWCPKIKRCSDGIDRHRMEWETAGCLKDKITSCSSDSSSISGGEIAVIAIVLLVVIFIVAWFVYAYYHPQSKSGLFLMKYGNPTKWCRNSSENTSTDGGRISFKTMAFESNA